MFGLKRLLKEIEEHQLDVEMRERTIADKLEKLRLNIRKNKKLKSDADVYLAEREAEIAENWAGFYWWNCEFTKEDQLASSEFFESDTGQKIIKKLRVLSRHRAFHAVQMQENTQWWAGHAAGMQSIEKFISGLVDAPETEFTTDTEPLASEKNRETTEALDSAEALREELRA